MKRYFHITAAAALLFLLASCGGKATEEEAVKRLVGKYNNAIARAYKDGYFAPLQKVAAGMALSQVDNAYQAYLNGKGIVMDAELLGLTFENIRLGSGKDESEVEVEWIEDEKEWREVFVFKETFVDTKERWKYKWVDSKTGEPASPIMTVNYRIGYTLDYVGGKRMIVKTEIAEEVVAKTEDTGVEWNSVGGRISAAH